MYFPYTFYNFFYEKTVAKLFSKLTDNEACEVYNPKGHNTNETQMKT